MARVSVTINKQSYEIACEQGQEQSVLALAESIDEKVSALVSAVGHVGESRLLVMAALLMADEIQELKKDKTRIKAEADARVTDAVEKIRLEHANNQSQTQSMTLKTLSEAAKRMESIAQRIEAS
ncbi:MAG: cell division protein ZapA [Rhodospirillaceae bacterium]|nr:cell division protein ZapA [Rhodospirillaceae bacterium]